MKPTNFQQSTKVLQKPSSMTDEECTPLPVWSDGKECVSCWKPSLKERIKILFGGNVWLGVYSGKTQPPVFVTSDRIFPKTPFAEQIRAFWAEVKESVAERFESLKNALKQRDKWMHFVAGFLISLVIGSVLGMWTGLVFGNIAGILKEWWDSKGHGTVEVMDVLFTIFGALCAMPLSWLFFNLIW